MSSRQKKILERTNRRKGKGLARTAGRKRKKATRNGAPKPKPPAVVYTLREDPVAKPSYVGVTNNPPRRAGEHKADGKPGELQVETELLPREEALALERELQKELGLRRPPRSGRFRTRRRF